MFSMLRIVHCGRVDAALDGRVLGRQAEGVEADGEEDVVAVHAQEAGARVGGRLDVPVADVQVARRVGVHREQVVLAAASVSDRSVLVQPRVGPALLPVRLDDGRLVARHAIAVGRGGWGVVSMSVMARASGGREEGRRTGRRLVARRQAPATPVSSSARGASLLVRLGSVIVAMGCLW